MYTHEQIEAISKENDEMRETLGAVGVLLHRLISCLDGRQLDVLEKLEDIYTVIHLPREDWPKIKGWE